MRWSGLLYIGTSQFPVASFQFKRDLSVAIEKPGRTCKLWS
jgi:hypothetical protein